MATDTETVSNYSIQARSKSKYHYEGVSHVPETEQQDKSSESEDDIPVATLLRKENTFTMTEQQKKDCLEGPQGERAIGVVVAKTFDGVEFRGTVDSFRKARQRHYYHVVYTDGDEEELSQTELRDGYLLGLSDEIRRHWNMYVGNKKGKRKDDKSIMSDVDTSEGEGSEYDKDDFESDLRNKKRQRKENQKSSMNNKKNELSAIVLPMPGETTVASEAFAKLTEPQNKLVASHRASHSILTIALLMFYYNKVARKSVCEQIFEVGHKDLVKAKLVALLTSEMVPVSFMNHDGICESSSVEAEGTIRVVICYSVC